MNRMREAGCVNRRTKAVGTRVPHPAPSNPQFAMLPLSDNHEYAPPRTRRHGAIFTPCAPSDSLLEAMTEAAKDAPVGGANRLSPACSSFDQFRNCQQSGEILCHS